MIWFEYTYNTPSEILSSITVLSHSSIKDFSIIVFIVVLYLCLVYYVIPYFKILWEYMSQEKKKRERKNFINKIALQKDLEEEIERELQISKKTSFFINWCFFIYLTFSLFLFLAYYLVLFSLKHFSLLPIHY